MKNSMDLLVLDSASVDPIETIKTLTRRPDIEREKYPFYLVNLDEILVRHKLWTESLPRVEPFYAIKCNFDPALLRVLAHLGTGFDCASQLEIKTILDLGVSPDRIIYAHPIKQSTYLDYAYQAGVNLMTFDCQEELVKIKKHHPNAKCVLRLEADDSTAVYKLNNKFGVDVKTARKLVKATVDLGVELVGVCFHVGCEQKSPLVFRNSIREAREIFDYARDAFGLRLKILDIGGGYPGETDLDDLFVSLAKEINSSLDEYFPAELFAQNELRIFGEPGRFYSCSAFTICTNIIGKRVNDCPTDGEGGKQASIMYFLNAGDYSAFRWYDKKKYFPILIDNEKARKEKVHSSIWGATADGGDVVYKSCQIPELEIDDYLVFVYMGAYTTACSLDFNFIPLPKIVYAVTKSFWEQIASIFE